MAIKIEDVNSQKKLREYLEYQPKELAQAIASRCALRVLPFLQSAFTSVYQDRYTLTQSVFRCSLISWAAADAAGAAYAAGAAVRAAGAADAAYAANTTFATVGPAANTTFAAIFAAYATVYAASVDVTGRAPDKIADAADAAANAADAAADAADAAIWKSIQQDLELFESKGESGLIKSVLRYEGTPTMFSDNWSALKKNLLAEGGDWQVWTDWYEHVLHGASSPKYGIAALSEEKLIELAQKPNEFWERDPDEVNAEIAGWVEEALKLEEWMNEDSAIDEPVFDYVEIPEQKSASVNPIWKDGVLFQSSKPLETSLDENLARAFMQTAASELLQFSKELFSQSNQIDVRIIPKLEDVAILASSNSLDSAQLFTLCHKEAFLYEYMATVEAEWPPILAMQYKSNCGQLTKALDRFADRRAFDRDVIEAEVENISLDEINKDATEFSEVLQSDVAKGDVDISIVDTLTSIGQDLTVSENIEVLRGPVSEKALTKVKADKLESMNNISKAIVNETTKTELTKVLKDSQQAYAESFADNYVEASRDAGKEDAKIAAKAANRVKVAELVGKGILIRLKERYPKPFGWVKQFNNKN